MPGRVAKHLPERYPDLKLGSAIPGELVSKRQSSQGREYYGRISRAQGLVRGATRTGTWILDSAVVSHTRTPPAVIPVCCEAK